MSIHLDHCRAFPQVIAALQAGVTSCMIDGSSRSFEENVALTQKTVEVCRAAGVPVEAELGVIGGVEDDLEVADEDAWLTPVETAAAFAETTGVDALAVAIGSAHGMYNKEPHLHLERLKAIHDRLAMPIVLHGGSGIPEAQITASLDLGISKINFEPSFAWRSSAASRKEPASFPTIPGLPLAAPASGSKRWCAARSPCADPPGRPAEPTRVTAGRMPAAGGEPKETGPHPSVRGVYW